MRMLKVSWTEFVSNEKVLGKVKEIRQILTSITQRQLKFFWTYSKGRWLGKTGFGRKNRWCKI